MVKTSLRRYKSLQLNQANQKAGGGVGRHAGTSLGRGGISGGDGAAAAPNEETLTETKSSKTAKR